MPTNFLSLPRELRQEIIYLALNSAIIEIKMRAVSPYYNSACACPEWPRAWRCYHAKRADDSTIECFEITDQRRAIKLWFQGLRKSSEVIDEDVMGASVAWFRRFKNGSFSRKRLEIMLDVLRDMW
jgi:hypothetical protein